MAKRRGRNRLRSNHFTAVEEAFFREGDREHEPIAVETFDDLDEPTPRPSFLQRLFARRVSG